MFSTSNEPNNYFYNLSVLTLEERAQLGALEGDYVGLRVTPLSNSTSSISETGYEVITDFADLSKKEITVSAISVAGFGCAAHGAASMARQVANVTGLPVVALIRSQDQGGLSGTIASPQEMKTAPDRDLELLTQLIQIAGSNLLHLVGYSRGGWVISHTLAGIEESELLKINPTVVTVGGVVDLPSYLNCKQYLGELDMVGAMNSDLDQPHEKVPMAGHHLNPAMAMFLNFSDVLGEALTDFKNS